MTSQKTQKADVLLYYVIWQRISLYLDDRGLYALACTASILREIVNTDAVWYQRDVFSSQLPFPPASSSQKKQLPRHLARPAGARAAAAAAASSLSSEDQKTWRRWHALRENQRKATLDLLKTFLSLQPSKQALGDIPFIEHEPMLVAVASALIVIDPTLIPNAMAEDPAIFIMTPRTPEFWARVIGKILRAVGAVLPSSLLSRSAPSSSSYRRGQSTTERFGERRQQLQFPASPPPIAWCVARRLAERADENSYILRAAETTSAVRYTTAFASLLRSGGAFLVTRIVAKWLAGGDGVFGSFATRVTEVLDVFPGSASAVLLADEPPAGLSFLRHLNPFSYLPAALHPATYMARQLGDDVFAHRMACAAVMFFFSTVAARLVLRASWSYGPSRHDDTDPPPQNSGTGIIYLAKGIRLCVDLLSTSVSTAVHLTNRMFRSQLATALVVLPCFMLYNTSSSASSPLDVNRIAMYGFFSMPAWNLVWFVMRPKFLPFTLLSLPFALLTDDLVARASRSGSVAGCAKALALAVTVTTVATIARRMVGGY